jgi:hypothetical protein
VTRWRYRWIGLPLVILGLGCGIAPRTFRGLNHPAPIVRARAVGLGDGLPEGKVVPALIDHLGDPDPVVRLTAHEELRRRTGQDFGYVPWADAAERAAAMEHWRAWWKGRQAALAKTKKNP